MSAGNLESLAIFGLLLGVLPAISFVKRPSTVGLRGSIGFMQAGYRAVGEAAKGPAEAAKYDGECHACGENFGAGTRIRWSQGVGAKHVRCG